MNATLNYQTSQQWWHQTGHPYLLQWGIRDAKAAEAHVSQGLLQLPKQTGIGPVLEPFIGEEIGQLLANLLNQLGFRNMVVDQAGDTFYVPCKRNRQSNVEGVEPS